jgi:hypothetical protein
LLQGYRAAEPPSGAPEPIGVPEVGAPVEPPDGEPPSGAPELTTAPDIAAPDEEPEDVPDEAPDADPLCEMPESPDLPPHAMAGSTPKVARSEALQRSREVRMRMGGP